MLDDLKLLNEEFFMLYGRLYHNLELISEKQYSFMADKLFEQYKTEYAKLSVAKEIEDKVELYSLKKRYCGYVPSGHLFWKNESKKLIDEDIKQELFSYYKKKREELAKAGDDSSVQEPSVESAKDNKGEKR